MNQKSISILGSGWLGLPLAKMFQENGYSVKSSTTSKEKMIELKNLTLDPSFIDIDDLPHSLTHFFNSKYLIINIPSKNLQGFKTLITKIEQSEISHVIYVSSTSVYTTSNEEITESDKFVDYNNPFALIENLFRTNKQFSTTIIRFAGLIGKNRNPAIFFKSRIIKNQSAPVNLIHQEDCLQIIKEFITKSIWNETFNACSDSHPTKREFYSYASKSAGKVLPTFDENSHTGSKLISNNKLKKVLNYSFIHPDLMKINFSEL